MPKDSIPTPPAEVEELLRIASRLWLREYGAPKSYSVVDAQFLWLAEGLLWEEVGFMGLLSEQPANG